MSAAHVAVLREARVAIENRTQVFLCNAITFRGPGYSEPGDAEASELVHLIEKRLGNLPTLVSWMRKHHPHLLTGEWTIYYTEQLRLTRLAWIDSLIEEFS